MTIDGVKIPYVVETAESKSRPNEPLNLYFLTLPQLMDYYDCKERANYKRAKFMKLFAEAMKKYGKDENGEDLIQEENEYKEKYKEKERSKKNKNKKSKNV